MDRGNLQGQLSLLKNENTMLQRRLSNKAQENQKLQQRVEKVEGELEHYKNMFSQIHHQISQGASTQSIKHALSGISLQGFEHIPKKKGSKKNQNSNCPDCCCEPEKRFVCDWPNCGKRFMRKYNLQEHQKMHSPMNPNMCTYPDCGKVFSSKYALARHQNVKHNFAL